MNNKGFTIIETLIVIVIISLLIWIITISYKAAQCEKHRDAPITSVPSKCIDYLVGE